MSWTLRTPTPVRKGDVRRALGEQRDKARDSLPVGGPGGREQVDDDLDVAAAAVAALTENLADGAEFTVTASGYRERDVLSLSLTLVGDLNNFKPADGPRRRRGGSGDDPGRQPPPGDPDQPAPPAPPTKKAAAPRRDT